MNKSVNWLSAIVFVCLCCLTSRLQAEEEGKSKKSSEGRKVSESRDHEAAEAKHKARRDEEDEDDNAPKARHKVSESTPADPRDKSVALTTVTALAVPGVLADSATSADAAQANEALSNATGPYEDMVGPALAGNAQGIAKLLAEADEQAIAVKKFLPPAAASELDGLLRAIHKAQDAGHFLEVAQHALAAFRLLVDNLRSDALQVPKEVSLLDYAGYQLEVLAASEKPDWDAMSQVAADAETWWNTIAKSKVTDKNLRATVTSTIAGLKQAMHERNLPMLKFAARIDLDLVDLLENSF